MAKLYRPNGQITDVYPANGHVFADRELESFVEPPLAVLYLDSGGMLVYSDCYLVEGFPYNVAATKRFAELFSDEFNPIAGAMLELTLEETRAFDGEE